MKAFENLPQKSLVQLFHAPMTVARFLCRVSAYLSISVWNNRGEHREKHNVKAKPDGCTVSEIKTGRFENV